jgi:hypothetical protein
MGGECFIMYTFSYLHVIGDSARAFTMTNCVSHLILRSHLMGSGITGWTVLWGRHTTTIRYVNGQNERTRSDGPWVCGVIRAAIK